jgi:hypothetical protein
MRVVGGLLKCLIGFAARWLQLSPVGVWGSEARPQRGWHPSFHSVSVLRVQRYQCRSLSSLSQ